MLEKGNRYLLSKEPPSRHILNPKINLEEHFILEVSDSNLYFKSRTMTGKIEWYLMSKYKLIEKLNREDNNGK